MPDLMRQCHVHVCPSRWEEPYGLVAVEAKTVGIPSIIFPSGGLKELIEHGTNGYLVYDHPGSVCWGINSVFGNFDHARWMGERGRVKAAYGFSWDAIAEQTEKIYYEIL